MVVGRVATYFGLNLNWIFSPVVSWRRREKLAAHGRGAS